MISLNISISLLIGISTILLVAQLLVRRFRSRFTSELIVVRSRRAERNRKY